MYESEDYKKEKKIRFRGRKGRYNGDRYYYMILHNIISMFLFFWLAISMGLFGKKTQIIQELFRIEFVELFIYVFALTIFTGLIARGISYVILYLLIVKWRKQDMKKIGEINYGIDAINFNYIISSLLASLLFSIGALVILQDVIFNSNSIISLFLSYGIMKSGVYLLVKLFSNLS